MRDASWLVRRRSAPALAQLGESGRLRRARSRHHDFDPYVANMATVVEAASSFGALLELTEN